MGPTQIKEFCPIDDRTRQLLGTAMRQMQLNARAYHRILKLARTISDLAGEERVGTVHIAEAIEYRSHLLSRNEIGLAMNSVIDIANNPGKLPYYNGHSFVFPCFLLYAKSVRWRN